jgi:hypothetical protein
VKGSEDEIFSLDDIEDDEVDRDFEDQLALEQEEKRDSEQYSKHYSSRQGECYPRCYVLCH